MADETTQDTAEKPLAPLIEAENRVDPPEIAHEMPQPDEPMSAVDRLRAFEDRILGPKAPRFNGALERGVGSLWHRMTEADKDKHAKLEKLVETEAKLSAAHSALIAADTEHDKALAAVEASDG